MERSRDRIVRRPPAPHPPGVMPPPEVDQFDVGIPYEVAAAAPPASLRLDAPSLLVSWSFRGVGLGARLLDGQIPGAFTIGSGRGAHAPVSPAYVGGAVDHTLVERLGDGVGAGAGAGFLLRLSPVMRAVLLTDGSCLELGPDLGRVEAGLGLRPTDVVRVECGDVTFDVAAAAPEAPLPRPWLGAAWRREAAYALGVAALMLLGLLIVSMVPPDPRSLSLDDLHIDRRWLPVLIKPPEPLPEPPLPGAGQHEAGAPGVKAARGPAGAAGDRAAPRVDRRLARKGPPDNKATPVSAAQVADRLEKTTMLGLLKPTTGAMADLLSDKPALGQDAEDVLGHLDGQVIGAAYGVGGFHEVGTGSGGGGTGEAMLGVGGLGTIGMRQGGPDGNSRYGRGAGTLGRRVAKAPEILLGVSSVRGSLDKEIVRRIVRRNINQVRFCYEQGLARHPDLTGRVVVQFMIAANGSVMTSLLQSTTLADAAATSCMVQAVRRWEFPAPSGGGMVQVSYPFQFTPAGG